VVVALALTMTFVELPWQSRLSRALTNTGHVAATGAIAIAMLAIVRQCVAARIAAQYALALVGAIVLGAAVEILQATIGRDAELADLARDALGAGVFLLFAFLADPGTRAIRDTPRKRWKTLVLCCAFALLLASSMDVLIWGSAYLYRDLRFPVLVSFGSAWQTRFVSLAAERLEFVDRPSAWAGHASARVGRITLGDERYSGFSLEEPHPDWRGFEWLTIDLFSDEVQDFQLTVRVHDAAHDQDYADRYNREFLIRPGAQRIRIALSEIEVAPARRRMDMSEIAGLVAFVHRPPRRLVIHVDGIRLE